MIIIFMGRSSKILRNIGICYQDYFSEYLPFVEVDKSGFLKEANALVESGNYSAIKTLAIKVLEKENLSMATRLYHRTIFRNVTRTNDSKNYIRE